jgi:2-polyprenyl-3-methyl-5-hydroxy-6-metoxy-1,4-benzoquinol methylase
MQITPALKLNCGYDEVRGAYFGQAGQTVRKVATMKGREVFACDIDLFDVESDVFPYENGYFDLVLACEIIEHLERDPMHMLLEIRRVLTADGILLITTPNCASISSLANLLNGNRNADVFSAYPRPEKRESKGVHVREYTSDELYNLLCCAGFQIQQFFTTRPDPRHATWVYDLLRERGFSSEHRGEQIYCLAAKFSGAHIVRYPDFLYAE